VTGLTGTRSNRMSDSQHTIGYLAQVACTWEVLARKAGNVCPGREFPDLRVNDFLISAAAIAPVLEQAPHQPLGVTVLRCIGETRKVVSTNTNLGIVLLLAPLASVALDQPLRPGLSEVLARTTVDDSRNVYAAIRLAKPGGLGEVKEQDVRDEPTLPLRDVMALAEDRDLIAAQYATDFAIVLDFAGAGLVQGVQKHGNIERSIIEMQLYLLFRTGDDLIHRKLGDQAGAYRISAMKVLSGLDTPQGRQAFLDFDAFLRSDHHARNPGTTADMIAAMLFVALREKKIPLTTPFVWQEHPFSAAPI
jgi:triphosphoribosyl-dephospho-CoA synthase